MNLPYLDFHLNLCVLEISTSLMYERHEAQIHDFILLRTRLLGKWGFSFRLYSPNKRPIKRNRKIWELESALRTITRQCDLLRLPELSPEDVEHAADVITAVAEHALAGLPPPFPIKTASIRPAVTTPHQ
jgi:hypothetical protein